MKSAILLLLVAVPAYSQTQPQRNWKDSAELSYISSSGNVQLRTLGASNTFNWEKGKTGAEIKASALSSESGGTQTAEKYEASEKVTQKFSGQFYVYEQYKWLKDRFSGIFGKHDATAGLGAELWKSAEERDLLVMELGAGYVWEDLIAQPNKDYAAGRAFLKYDRKLSATASFMQNAEYLHNFEDGEDYVVSTETALVASIRKGLALKVAYKWKHDHVPPIGARRNDHQTTVALVINF